MNRRITKIEAQKRRRDRVSVYLDDQYAFGLDAELVLKFGLKEGGCLTQEQINQLLLHDERKRAKDRALRFLVYRARSEKEIVDKLSSLGYEQRTIEWVLSELKRLGFVNDLEFALSFSRSKMVTKPMGQRLLHQELQKKGVSREIIDKVMDEIYKENDPLQIARALAEKRKKQYKDLDQHKLRKRICDFLFRRGFDWEIIQEVLNDLK